MRYHLDLLLASPSIYVNGSIYWLPDMFESDNMKDGDIVFILAIDVGSQKFRKIQIPKFIVDQCFDCRYGSLFEQYGHLLEVNGCLAISTSTSASAVKIWIHDDNHHSKHTSAETGNENWTEHTLTVPSSVGIGPVLLSFRCGYKPIDPRNSSNKIQLRDKICVSLFL